MKGRLIFLAATALATACDPVHSYYETLEDARADSLFERGWLPDVLPPSAREILVKNDLDLSTSEGQFLFAPSEFEAFLNRLSPKSQPADTKLAAVEAIVDRHIAEGYAAYWHRESDWEWVFLCIPERGVCLYYLS